jgi:hypothetical protein
MRACATIRAYYDEAPGLRIIADAACDATHHSGSGQSDRPSTAKDRLRTILRASQWT